MKGYNEDILLLVILTMTYSEKIPVIMVRSKSIDWVMGMMINGELMRAAAIWKQAYFGFIMSGSLQLPLPRLQPYSIQAVLSG